MIHDYAVDVLKIYSKFKKCSFDRTKLYFGVELETEPTTPTQAAQNRLADQINDCFNQTAICKYDGSLNNGVEIVTVPATLRYHERYLWNKFFNSLKNNEVKDIKASQNCGLHIHFSRNALTDLQMAKFILFMNEDVNSAFLTKIAGRESRYFMKKYWDKNVAAKKILDESISYGRGAAAFSHRNNNTTCEVRIFKSYLTKRWVFQSLEFCAALIEYCSIDKLLDQGLAFTDFIKWFETENKKIKYRYLDRNFKQLGYIKDTYSVKLFKTA